MDNVASGWSGIVVNRNSGSGSFSISPPSGQTWTATYATGSVTPQRTS